MSKLPLKVNPEFYSITNSANVASENIMFGNVGLGSERCVTVCESGSDGNGQLVTIDLSSSEVSRRPNKADAILPHPTRNVNAVRVKSPENPQSTVVQIINMDSKKRLVNTTVPDLIKFWKWYNSKTLALIGLKSAYHINIENLTGEAQTPEKIADREGALGGVSNSVQVIDYSCCPSKNFSYMVGLSKKENVDGTTGVGGTVQLTSLALKKSQFIDAYSCCFGQLRLGDDSTESTLFAYSDKNKSEGKVVISEITPGVDPSKKFKASIDLKYSDDSEMNFPVFMSFEETLGLLFIITKMGTMFLLEVSEGALLLRSKISDSHIVSGVMMTESHGCIVLNKAGNLISIEVDPLAFVQFVNSAEHIKNNQIVANKIACRIPLPGKEGIYTTNFNRLFGAGQYDEAAKYVARSPDLVLRNKDTIEKFKNLPRIENSPHPLLKYFQILLDNGKLNEIESLEIAQLVLAQKKTAMVERWFDDGKLSLTDDLISIVRNNDNALAEKMSQLFKSKGDATIKQQEKLLGVKVANSSPEELVNQLKGHCMTDPSTALNFAKALAKTQKLSSMKICEIFLQANLFDQLTRFAVDYLTNTPDSASWQTMILEQSLKTSPSVADSILQTGKWTYYNKPTIGALCEQKGLYLRALENYTDIRDIKRIVLNHAHLLPPEYLKSFVLQTLPSEHIVAVLTEILRYSKNIKLVVDIASSAQEKVPLMDLCSIFESIGSYEGVVYLLNPQISKLKDSVVIHKYLEASIKCGQHGEVERVINELGGFYDQAKTLDLLLNARLPDPRCLVMFCDKHGYIKEMIQYLWENQMTTVIETYVFHLNPTNSGDVLGILMDLGVEENYISKLLANIRGGVYVEKLISEFELRNRLRLLEKWLQDRIAEGNILPEVHDALAKLLIDFDRQPEKFLKEDRYYNPKVVGKYAETRDPHLAFTAYSRDYGTCDEDIMDLTEKNGLYRLQAVFLVQRQSPELWNRALRTQNSHRVDLVEQIISSVLPASKSAEEVSSAVQAFIAADMPEELLFLLEKIILHSGQFASFKKLQNLLIITAIRTDKSRVMDYLTRLDNYDGLEVVKHCINPQFALYEEAFEIYKKLNMLVEAADVLIENIGDLSRAVTFAEKSNKPEVWSSIGVAFLNQKQLVQAIDCFIKAKDPNLAGKVIELAGELPNDEKLLEYLTMTRSIKKDSVTDNEYLFTLSRLNRLAEIESFIAGPNTADLARVAESLFETEFFEASKLIFIRLKSNARIASCQIKLNSLSEAIEYAKKANTSKTWREVAFACIENREFKLAAIASASVALFPDHLEELVVFYELHDASDEIIQVLEQAITNEKSHVGIFTELAILLARNVPARLFDYLRTYFAKLNSSKIQRICKKYGMWQELVFLHSNQQEYDSAAQIMMEHSPSCFSHDSFVALLLKSSNQDMLYRAIGFYIEENPMRLNEILRQLALRLDLSKAVGQIRRAGLLPLVIDWLKSVQSQNVQAINDALNQIYLETGDFESLRNSILAYDSIDAIGIAKQIESSDQPEFRRLSALIYRRNGKFKESIELALSEKHYMDSIETAKESNCAENAENLLRYFAKSGNKEFFTIVTKVCFELLSPDLVLETSWLYNFTDFSMPFMIQYMKNVSTHMSQVTKKQEEFEKKEEEKQKREATAPLGFGLVGGNGLAPLINSGIPMLTGGFGSSPATGDIGFNQNKGPNFGAFK